VVGEYRKELVGGSIIYTSRNTNLQSSSPGTAPMMKLEKGVDGSIM
jgi:hypothetical protein